MSGKPKAPKKEVFDMKHVDGRIVLDGLIYPPRHFKAAVELTRAEVLALVKFATELWPDQVARLVLDTVGTVDGDICVACGNQLRDHSRDDARKCAAAMDAGGVA